MMEPRDLGDQRPRRAERDPGAHAVVGVAAPEPVGEPLAQPALDPARRHQHELLSERVVRRCREQGAECLGKLVGAGCAVEPEGHVSGSSRVSS